MTEKAKKIRNIPIALPSLGTEELEAVKEPILKGWLTQGSQVAKFEAEFSNMHNVSHALATTSCTTALHSALVAMGIGPGDEVIVPAFTWVSTANIVLYCGATLVFCDVDIKTYNIKVSDISSKITDRTKAIIPVHLFGLCADIDAIKRVIPSHIKILEDAACAAGASYKNRFAGSLGDMGAFSFHPRKTVTCGEGGMLTTNDNELNIIAEKLRNHGAEISEEKRHLGPKPFILPDFNVMGFNYRMTDLQAAVGIAQLSKLNHFIKEREYWARYYTQELASLGWLIPQSVPKFITQHAWQAYVCYVDPDKAPMTRNEIMENLQAKGIATRPGTHAVHMLGFYSEKYSFKSEDFPGAYACDQNTMAIPLHNKMVADDYRYIVEVLKSI